MAMVYFICTWFFVSAFSLFATPLVMSSYTDFVSFRQHAVQQLEVSLKQSEPSTHILSKYQHFLKFKRVIYVSDATKLEAGLRKSKGVFIRWNWL